jgi:TonB family protein
VNERWVPSLSFLIALALHAGLFFLAGQHYLASSGPSAPVNQAARRLDRINGQPVRFVYVKDMVPSKEPPMDPSRLSDVNRRGASPDPRKGSSPDPTSMGGSSIRQSGGPGGAPETRPSMPARPAGSRPVPERAPSPAQQQAESGQGGSGQARAGAAAQAKPEGNTRSKPAADGAGQATAFGRPANAQSGMPVDGRPEGQTRPGAERSSPAVPASPGRPGIASQLQRMMVGTLQGGYDNPNASRLNTGSLSFDTAAWDLGPYARQVQERVQSNWHIPGAQEVLRQKGWVAIRFNILKDGRVADLQLLRTSGIPSYDQAALDAMRASDPLPPLPSQVTVPKIGAVFRFFYNMPDGAD